MNPENQIYCTFLDALSAQNIPYACLRDDVTSDQPIKDLDLLTDAKNRAGFAKVAAENGFIQIKDDFLNPSKSLWLRNDDGVIRLLDVHEKVVCRGIEFLDVNRLLQNRREVNGFFQLSPEDYLMSLLFHNVLAKKKIQEKHAPLLKSLLAKAQDKAYIEKHLREYGLWQEFVTLTQNLESAIDDERIVAASEKRAREALLQRESNRSNAKMLESTRRKLKFFGKKRGVVIAFIGPDGAGKSTTIKAIQERLKQAGLGGKVAYMGPWGDSVLKLRKIFKPFRPSPYRDDYKAYDQGKTDQKPGPLKGAAWLKFQFRSLLYYALLHVEMQARWFIRVMPMLRQGRVVLSDRYIYDILTGYKNRPMDYQVELREAMCDRYPRPDVGILLDAEPETIFARKPQLNEAELTRARDAYHKIAQDYGFVKLDTSHSVERTLAEFDKNILPTILVKFPRKRLNAKIS